jgi:methylenetetrahydrofolate dehydrogenase (NADP+)/methenyltetrahydrofolate cyclohydrolase
MQLLKAKPLIEKNSVVLKEKSHALLQTLGRAPHLSVILIGSDPSSQIYVNNKAKAAEKVGFTSDTFLFEAHTPPAKVFELVQQLNDDPNVDGILIQRPLPKGYLESEVAYWVAPEKDVDCLHPENVGLLVNGTPRFKPCTPAGIIDILDFYQIPIEGKIACVIGRSSIVGKPLAALLLGRNASIIQIHRSTTNPKELCKQADLVFVAAGSAGLVKKDWLKQGAVVIDVGINRNADGKITGDVDAKDIESYVSALTPVPGGVGPMTIQVLLENTLKATLSHA